MVIFFKYPKRRRFGDGTPEGIWSGLRPAHSRPPGNTCLNEVTGQQISAHSDHSVLPSHKRDSLATDELPVPDCPLQRNVHGPAMSSPRELGKVFFLSGPQ